MPDVSPDGEHIVFVSTRDGIEEIYIMDANGANQVNLTLNDGSDLDPDFSPDGSNIIFISNREGYYGIYMLETNGSNLNSLSTNSGGDFSPRFSPDGTQIVYQAYTDGNYEVYLMNADGTYKTNLTNDSGSDKEPQFQPFTELIFIEIEYSENWNLVSVPLSVQNTASDSLFPGSVEGTLFSFDGSYIPETELELGEGYWLRFDTAGTVVITGTVIHVLAIEVNEGWNLIGSISHTVDANNFLAENELIIPGTIFEFNGSYESADFIVPGKSYWVRTNDSGIILLNE